MQTDKREIQDLFNTWHDATVAGDLAKVLSLMADDVVFLVAGQAPFGKDTFAAGFQAAHRQFRIQYTRKTEELQVAGDLAYCRSYLSVTMTPLNSSRSMCRSGYTLTILRKQPNGTWMLTQDANLLTA